MKPGPLAAMVVLLVLGVWLVLGPQLGGQAERTPGAVVHEIIVGPRKLRIEQMPRPGPDGPVQFRALNWPEVGDDWMTSEAYESAVYRAARESGTRPIVLKIFNVTSWWNLAWIGVGLGGQAAFFGRMLVQWVVSEKKRQSVVPDLFWWLSLGGGVCLFAYFVWRQDLVGVLGQCTGIVIYARNIRLIFKQRRRARRAAAQSASSAGPSPEPPTIAA